MGTTESIPLDDTSSGRHSNNSGGADVGAAIGSVSGRGIPPSSVQRRRPSTGGGGRQQQQPITTAVRMSGLVLGMSQSGKQTLLARLEGKDPFADQSLDDYSQRAEATVPYRPPPQKRVWDRIQLQVQVSRSVGGVNGAAASSGAANRQRVVDFAVLLINPTHDPARIRNYLEDTIADLLRLQGYRSDEDDDGASGKDSNSRAADANDPNKSGTSSSKRRATSPGARPNPFCLCILLNFRDRMSPGVKWLEQSDVQAFTMDVLQSFSLEPDRIVLQCGHTSLYDCYGLDLLHHFIYQAYLQRKRTNLENFLHQIHDAQIESNRNAPSTSYDDFLVRIGRRPQSSSSSQQQKQKQRQSAGSTGAHSSQQRRSTTGEAAPAPAETADQSSHSDGIGGGEINRQADSDRPPSTQQRRRKILPGQQGGQGVGGKPERQPRPAPVVQQQPPNRTRAALEAFLASDSEEEGDNEGQDKAASRRKPRRYTAGPADSSDEDDEFFYDESGHRQSPHHNNHLPESKQKNGGRGMATRTRTAACRVDDHVAPVSEISVPNQDGRGEALSDDDKKDAHSHQASATETTHASTVASREGTTTPMAVVEAVPPPAKSGSQQLLSHQTPTTAKTAAIKNNVATPLRPETQLESSPNSSSSTLLVEEDFDDLGVKTSDTPQPGSTAGRMAAGEAKAVAAYADDEEDEEDSMDEIIEPTEVKKRRSTISTSSDEKDFFLGDSARLRPKLNLSTASPSDDIDSDDDGSPAKSRRGRRRPFSKENVDDRRSDGSSSDDEDDYVIDGPADMYSSRNTKKGSSASPATAGPAGGAKTDGQATDAEPSSSAQELPADTPSAAVKATTSDSNVGGGGLSAAARAAIAAAQKEAELMLQQGSSPQQHIVADEGDEPSSSHHSSKAAKKEKKKKKSSKEEKKKKKKSKDGSSSRTSGGSDSKKVSLTVS